jgi:tRNA1Val (adenine37-N6)-methyltransferase
LFGLRGSRKQIGVNLNQMSKNVFHFRRFSVLQECCGHKVGTDSILLGALVTTVHARRILDIGTGTGVVSLLLAQRTESQDTWIEAVEIEARAAMQAQANFRASSWAGRLDVQAISLQQYVRKDSWEPFDLVVCNPPWFRGSRSPDPARDISRHEVSLSLPTLFRCVNRLLHPRGTFGVILPVERSLEVEQLTEQSCMCIHRSVDIIPLPGRAPRRRLFEVGRAGSASRRIRETLLVEHWHHNYTEAFYRLTRDFYLPGTFRQMPPAAGPE